MDIDTVIFVPGICGSVLCEGEQVIWPGTPMNALFHNYPDEAVQILSNSKTLRATDVLRSVELKVLGTTIHHFDGYGRALSAIENMGFKTGRLIAFPYDWRVDVRESAKTLLHRIKEPDLAGKNIAIVAHSMGGLVTRYALERLERPESIKLCVLVATPHLGAPVALQNLLGRRPEMFLSAEQCREALKNPDFPSAYQLLPRPGIPVLLRVSATEAFEIADPYRTQIAQQLALTLGSLDAAKALASELPLMAPGFAPPCRYVAIAGNAHSTIGANYLDPDGAIAIEEPSGGDGTVPLWSSAAPGIPVRYVAATHADIFKDSDTIALLKAVLKPRAVGGRLFGKDPVEFGAELSLQALKPSVARNESFAVGLVADRPASRIEAQIRVSQFVDQAAPQVTRVPINYIGGPMRAIPVPFQAPDRPGVLLFEIEIDGKPTNGASQTSVLVR